MSDRPAIIEAYDEWHARHDTGRGPWYDLVRDRLRVVEGIDGLRVLEIGCGSGEFAGWLAERHACDVVGIDVSQTAIDKARSRYRQPNLSFHTGDIQNLDHAAATFDLVISCETVEHVPDPRRAVSELARVLRPGGTLLITVPNYLSLAGLHRLFRIATGRVWDEGGQPLAHWTSLPRTLAWVRSAGLGMESVDGKGWYVPVPGRPGGRSLRFEGKARRVLRFFGLHVLVAARKPGV